MIFFPFYFQDDRSRTPSWISAFEFLFRELKTNVNLIRHKKIIATGPIFVQLQPGCKAYNSHMTLDKFFENHTARSVI